MARSKPSIPEPPPPSHLQLWIRRVSFGAFLLAAIALVWHAVSLAKFGGGWSEIRTYVVGIFVLGLLLLIVDFAIRQLKTFEASPYIQIPLAVLLTILFFALLVLAVVWGGTLILRDVGLIPSPGPPAPVAAEEEIRFVTGQTYRSADLPESIFGSKTNDASKSRLWMDLIEKGAIAKLGDSQCYRLWLLADAFDKATSPFDAHIYVHTGEPIVIQAFHVGMDGMLRVSPLPQVQGQGPKDEYVYQLSKSSAPGDRLLVFIAMKKTTYEGMAANPRFQIRSRTLLRGGTP